MNAAGIGSAILSRAWNDPTLRAALLRAASRLVAGEADYRRIHWGERGRGAVELVAPEPPDRVVHLGALSRLAYVTSKAGEMAEFVHTFGEEQADGSFVGPRPRLVVGFYDDGRPAELFILRGASSYDVTSHGIEG